ncbi:MAG: ImmA/IrrE family metallo-endopeptidase [Polyangiaceae bacterium]|nr:ImmA/IrrE family metallo-endopeptidase [Polyangiaceae bacterium]
MDQSILAANLARFRVKAGLTQAEVAEKSGISRQAYRSLETGESEPRTRTLMGVADALGVKIEALLRPTVKLRDVRFRSSKKMATRTQILADVARWLGDYHDLEKLLVCPAAHKLGSASSRSRKYPKETAIAARAAFGLEPGELIRDICGLLEDNGVKVFLPKVASEGFFGLSVGPRDGGPAVIVNTWDRISVERWIFSAAHELGHLVLHLRAYNVEEADEDEAEEREADQFASHFLMPDEVFQKEWEEARGLPLVRRVFKLKQMFRVSYKTVLNRVQEDTGSKAIWGQFYAGYKRQFGSVPGRLDEPDPLHVDDSSPAPVAKGAHEPERLGEALFMDDRLWRLVREAVEAGKISLGRAAEILQVDLRAMRDIANGWVA